MRTSAIPVAPVPLTAEQAETMLQRQIKKHHVAIILLHWFNAIVWLLELVDRRRPLISSRHFRVAPEWYLSVVQGVFGTRANMLQFHVALGLAVDRRLPGLRRSSASAPTSARRCCRRRSRSTGTTVRWLIVRTLRILGRTKEPLPPQGIYNAGQKLFALMVYAMMPVIMLTGVVMAFHLFGTQVVGWAVVLHFAAVGVVVSGLIIHVYMGAVFPEEKPAFFSMITGNVNELYAYSHHFKWWRELMMEERQWEQAHEDPPTGPPDAPATGSTRTPANPSARGPDRRFPSTRRARSAGRPPVRHRTPPVRRHVRGRSCPSGGPGAWSWRSTPGGTDILKWPNIALTNSATGPSSGNGVVDHERALPAVLESGNLVRAEPAGRHGVADDVGRDERHAFSVDRRP